MGVKTKIASIACAAALGLGVSTTALAQQTGDVPIDVQVGAAPDAGLTWQASQTAEFPSVPSSFEAQTSTGAIAATVSDTRGTEAGWTLSVSGTDFVGQTTGRTIPIGNLTLTPGAVQVVAGDANPLPTVNTLTMSTAPQVLMVAAADTGAGRYTSVINGTITIPGNTLVDTYASTITVDLAAAP
jgi:hypothetical protein